MTIKTLLFIFIAGLSLASKTFAAGEAKNTTCLSEKLVTRLNQDFKFLRAAGKQGYRVNSESTCDNKDLFFKVAKAIQLIYEMEFGSSLTKSFKLTDSQEGTYSYFNNRIKKILFEDEPIPDSSCNDDTLAYVHKDYPGTLFVCKATKENKTFEIASTLIHEARHKDGKYPHVQCLREKTDRNCDESFEDQGSHGISAKFAMHVAKYAKDPVVRDEARRQALLLLTKRFNVLPMNLKAGVLVTEPNGTASFFDGKSITSLFSFPSEFIPVFSSGTFPIFMNAAKQLSFYEYASMKLPSSKNDNQPEKQLIDASDGSQYLCMLYPRSLYCIMGRTSHSIELKGIRPRAILKNVSGALSIVAQDGTRFALPARFEDFQAIQSEDSLKPESPKNELLDLAQVHDGKVSSFYGVDYQNRLVIESPAGVFIPAPAFQNRPVKKIIPLIYSKMLEEL